MKLSTITSILSFSAFTLALPSGGNSGQDCISGQNSCCQQVLSSKQSQPILEKLGGVGSKGFNSFMQGLGQESNPSSLDVVDQYIQAMQQVSQVGFDCNPIDGNVVCDQPSTCCQSGGINNSPGSINIGSGNAYCPVN